MVFAVVQYTDGSSFIGYSESYDELLTRVDIKRIDTLDARLVDLADVKPGMAYQDMFVKKE